MDLEPSTSLINDFNMSQNIVDNYVHPEKKVHYIKESIIGPGIKEDHFYNFFKEICACTQKNCIDSEECFCLKTYGIHYENDLLKNEHLESKKNVFECSRYCCCGATCNNAIVQRGPSKGLLIQFTSNKGYGVFAQKQFPKGAFICEYAGEIVGHEEAQKRMQNSNCIKYLMLVREHWENNVLETYVDAFKFGNIGRYLNHSCDPNCVVIPVRVGRIIPKLCFFANKPIEISDELTYFYCPGSTVFSRMNCFCGAPNCCKLIPSA